MIDPVLITGSIILGAVAKQPKKSRAKWLQNDMLPIE